MSQYQHRFRDSALPQLHRLLRGGDGESPDAALMLDGL